MAVRTKTAAFALGNTVERQTQFAAVFVKTAAGVFTDYTTAAANSTNLDVTFLGASNDEMYFGANEKFCAFLTNMGTVPVGGTRTWTYWNGSAWTAMPTITYNLGNANLIASSTAAHWDDTACTGWAKTTVNGVNAYFIRSVVGTAYSTAGVAGYIKGAIWDNVCTGSAGGTRTITIPETVSRTFRSVTLRIHWRAAISGGQLELFRTRMILGSGSLTMIEQNNTISQPSPPRTFLIEYDLTSQFVSNFTSTSHTIEVECANLVFNVAAATSTNWAHYTAQLFITYDSDDDPAQNATQINTLYIPFDSLTTALGTSTTTIGGTGGIPILTGGSGFIKEVSSPTILEEAIVYHFNTQEAGTTNYQFVGQIDSEAETVLLNFNAAGNSDIYTEVQWRRTDLTSTSAHDIKARVTSATGAAPVQVGGFIMVTYSFAASGITQRNMSMMIPIAQNPYFFRGTTANDAQIAQTQFWIEEASPTLQVSAVLLYLNQSADPGSYLLACGSQTARSYAVTTDSVAGPTPIVQRFDSGGAAGSGISFGRGLNTLVLKSYVDTSPTLGGGEYGIIILNYYATASSTKRTTYARWLLKQFSWTSSSRAVTNTSFPIAEANYYLVAAGYLLTLDAGDNIRSGFISVSKGSGAGWFNDGSGPLGSPDTFQGIRLTGGQFVGAFSRWPGDPDTTRVDIETARDYILELSTTSNPHACVTVHLAYHDYTYTISGQLANYSGDGSGITVNIYSKLLGKIGSATTTTGGNYTLTWYDDTASDVWAEARQSGTLLGRSDDGTAS